jgi:hypothetical protein
MLKYITAHGLDFGIETDGFAGNSADENQAVNNCAAALAALSAEQAAALHAALADVEGEYPRLASEITFKAVEPVTAGWHNPEAASLSLIAG